MKSRLPSKLLVSFIIFLCGVLMPAPVFAVQIEDYQDIDKSHWAYSYVQEVVEQGLFFGTDNTHFEPQTTMSRAMFLTVLYRYDGANAITDDDASEIYADVPIDTWYTEAVQWAADLGLLEDIAEENFYPQKSITREDMMTILHRYFNYIGSPLPNTSARFGTSLVDGEQISIYAQEAVMAGRWARIMTGFPDGNFLPQGESTRAQVAAVFSRSRMWQQIQQNSPHAVNSATVIEQHHLADIPYALQKTLITKEGFFAAYSHQGQVFLYNLNTRQTVANIHPEGIYCRHIAADEGGVTFYIVQEEKEFAVTAGSKLRITWQGETDLQPLSNFQLPFGEGFIAEWEGGIAYLNPQTGKRSVLARFAEDVEDSMGGPRRLELFDVIDEQRFIYTAKLDSWSLQTYVYDIRTKQSTPAPFNIPLGIENGRLLGSFGDMGLEGMIVADLDTLTEISSISFNDAGPSRAALSADGKLVYATYQRGENEIGLLLFAAQTGQLLETQQLNTPGGSIVHYGFWGRQPYFLREIGGKTILYVMPENIAECDVDSLLLP